MRQGPDNCGRFPCEVSEGQSSLVAGGQQPAKGAYAGTRSRRLLPISGQVAL